MFGQVSWILGTIRYSVQCLYARHQNYVKRQRLISAARRRILDNTIRFSCTQRHHKPSWSSVDESLIDGTLRLSLEDELPKRDRPLPVGTVPVVLCSAILLLIVLLVGCTPCLRYSKQIARHGLFLLEPYWDYNHVYETRCLLPNPIPYSRPDGEIVGRTNRQAEAACKQCLEHRQLLQNIKPHKFRSNIERSDISWHLKSGIPLFFNDSSVERWPLYGMRTAENWTDLYRNTRYDRVCMFRSSLPEVGDPYDFFDAISRAPSHDYSWFVQWENCGQQSKKAIRRLVERLPSIPLSVELSQPLWIMLAYGETHSQLEIRPLADTLIVVQLLGKSRFELVPKICSRCERLHERQHNNDDDAHRDRNPFHGTYGRISGSLQPNQVVVASNKLWHFNYRPDNDLENDGKHEHKQIGREAVTKHNDHEHVKSLLPLETSPVQCSVEDESKLIINPHNTNINIRSKERATLNLAVAFGAIHP